MTPTALTDKWKATEPYIPLRLLLAVGGEARRLGGEERAADVWWKSTPTLLVASGDEAQRELFKGVSCYTGATHRLSFNECPVCIYGQNKDSALILNLDPPTWVSQGEGPRDEFGEEYDNDKICLQAT